MESSTTGNGTGRARYGINAEEGCPPPLLLSVVRTLAPLVASVFSIGVSSQASADVLSVPSKTYPTIQSAITAAAASGDEIVVAPGSYNEAIDFLGKAINLHSSDGAVTTILDGSGLTTSIVRCVSGEGPGTILDGFTVSFGSAGSQHLPPNGIIYGFGMYNQGSSPTVKNCVFSNNGSSGSGSFVGGGIANIEGANAAITNCSFANNNLLMTSGTSGGGIYNSESNPTITDCTFTGNFASNGAGIANNACTNPAVSNSTFSNNTGTRGGGLFNAFSGGSVSNCTFDGNLASLVSGDGGGGLRDLDSSTIYSDCIFTGNQAYWGGGMDIQHSNFAAPTPTVVRCKFIGNSSTNLGGGLSVESAKPVIRDCIFSNNSAVDGGGARFYVSGPVVVNTIFEGNSATGHGGAIYLDTTSGFGQGYFPILSNCNILSNAAPDGAGGGIYALPSGSLQAISPVRVTNCIIRDNGSSNMAFPVASQPGWINIQYSNIQMAAITGMYYGHDNIDVDPMFDGGSDAPDYHLLPGSPCIDAGNHWYVPTDVDLDLDGSPRLTAAPGGDGFRWTDMGVYEAAGDNRADIGVFQGPIAYWTFNNLGLPASVFPADLGSGSISTAAWGGTLAPDGVGAFFDLNSVNNSYPAGTSLKLVNGSGGNNTYIQVAFSMSGYEDLIVSFVTRRNSSTSFTSGTWSWSTDGVNFTALPGVNTCSTALSTFPALQFADFSAVTALDNAPSVTLRYKLSGATNAARFVEIDNLQLNGTPLPPPQNPADITDDGIVDIDDLFAVINAWGPCPDPENCSADIAPIGPPQGNDVVDIDDLFTVINNWS